MSARAAQASDGVQLRLEGLEPGDPPRDPGGLLPDGGLTEEQEAAVGRRAEPLLLSAAAGSGKTRVLVERFVRAVCEDGIPPGRILAITFTERAAGELLGRVRARLLECGRRQEARDLEASFVSTFHGFCARLLRAHPLAADVDPDFTIDDESMSGWLREAAFRRACQRLVSSRAEQAVELMAAYGLDRLERAVREVHAELRSRGQRLPRLPPAAAAGPQGEEVAGGSAARGAWQLLGDLLVAFTDEYEGAKAARNALDFDDLELLAGDLLVRRGDVRAAWAERFELLMVDEFQDTNARQLAILRALDRDNLFTVGDELQSIYGFRHADVELFRVRRDELAAHGRSLRLQRSFRSHEQILDAVNAVFSTTSPEYVPLLAADPAAQAGAPEPRGGQESGSRVEVLLTDTRGWEQDEELARRVGPGAGPSQLWRAAEARALALRVAELLDGGRMRGEDVVVLLRSGTDLNVFERALRLCGVRTFAAVGAFWRGQEVCDVIAYLRTLANPLDELSLYGALASPLGGCSLDALALLASAAQERGCAPWEAALAATVGEPGAALERLDRGDRAALGRFCSLVERERAVAPGTPIAQLIERALAACGYRAWVSSLDGAELRLANIEKLMRHSRRFEAGEGRDLRAFLDHVERVASSGFAEPSPPLDGLDPDAVRLMTIHAAKGLEFPVVCVADLGRQPNVQTPDILVAGDRGGLRLLSLEHGGSTPALDYEELCADRRRREAEEEQRILYVAMTRARERLILSGALDFSNWPRPTPTAAPIGWIASSLAAELPQLCASGAGSRLELPIAGADGTRLGCRLNSASGWREDSRLPSAGGRGVGAGQAGSGGGAVGDGQGDGAVEPSPGASRAPSGAPRGGRARMAERDPFRTLSYSSLSQLERCGYRFYLERVLGLGEEPAAGAGRGLDARGRGVLVHRLMESLDLRRHDVPGPERVGETARALGLRPSRDERAEIARLVGSAAETDLARRLAAAETVWREHRFALALGPGEPLLTGVLDVLAGEPAGGMLVVDYKSDRIAADIDLDEHVEREYGIQRLLYAIAVLRRGARRVEVVHWFLERPDGWIGAIYGAEELLPLEARLRERIARARERGYAVSETPHRLLCGGCPGRRGLCSWGPEETSREPISAL